MSTTFGIKIPSSGEIVEIAFRNSWGIRFTNKLAPMLRDSIKVIPMDNTAQGIHTIKDIKNKIKEEIL